MASTTNTGSVSDNWTIYQPSQSTMDQWANLYGTASGLAQNVINNYAYQGQMVADPTALMQAYWNSGANIGNAPDMSGYQSGLSQVGQNMAGTVVDPSGINLPQYNSSSFQPGQINLPSFGAVPQVTAPGGVSGSASSYQINPQQVSAQQVSAPSAIDKIGGIQQVTAPQMQYFQMGPAQQVQAPNVQNFSMQAAANIAPQAQETTQSWTQPGTSSQYMSPYVQQVVNTQLAQAKTQEQMQETANNAQAAQAGAFGGDRAAIENANTQIAYQQNAAALEAQGLQNAYSAGTQQFNTEQALGAQAQQYNISAGLQAAQANQQMQQQANVQNLSSYLQTQGLGAQTGLQAAMANQNAGLTVGQANLGANVQTQALGAQLNEQSQLANQQMNYQTQLANQQAQEVGNSQTMQAQGMNQQANLQAGLANQQYGYQAQLAGLQMGQQGAEFNAGLGMQAGLANQAAGMQAQGMEYQGGLSSALQTQQLGQQGAEYGGQLGLSAAQQQYALQQQQQGLNLSAYQQQGGMEQAAANLGLSGYNAQLAGFGAQGQAATSEQGYQQQVADAAFQNWYQSMTLPMQAASWQASMLAQQPVPYTTTNAGFSNATQTTPTSNPLGVFIGDLLGAFGSAGGFGGMGGNNNNSPQESTTNSDTVSVRKGGLMRFADGGPAPADKGGLPVVLGDEAASRFTRTPISIQDMGKIRRLAAELARQFPGTKLEGDSGFRGPAEGSYSGEGINLTNYADQPSYPDISHAILHEDIHALLEKMGYKYPTLDTDPTSRWKSFWYDPQIKARDAMEAGSRGGNPKVEIPAYVGALKSSELPGFTEADRQMYLDRLYPTLPPDKALLLRRMLQMRPPGGWTGSGLGGIDLGQQ